MPIISLLLATSVALSAEVPDAVVVAIARHSGSADKNSFVCLTVAGEDPSKQLLSDIQQYVSGYVPGSKCVVRRGTPYLRGTNKHAKLMSIADFRTHGEEVATARVSSHFGPLSGGTWSATLKLVDGAWLVESTKIEVIY